MRRRHVCDARWHDITRSIFMRGASLTLPGQPPMKQPTWCRLQPDKFGAVAARVRSPHPENVLLVHSRAGSRLQQGLDSGAAAGSGLHARLQGRPLQQLAAAVGARRDMLPRRV